MKPPPLSLENLRHPSLLESMLLSAASESLIQTLSQETSRSQDVLRPHSLDVPFESY